MNSQEILKHNDYSKKYQEECGTEKPRGFRLSVIAVLIVFLFIYGCDKPNNKIPQHIPEFSAKSDAGEIISNYDLENGYALFFLVLENEISNNVVFEQVNNFEENESLELSKICLVKDGDKCHESWITIREPWLRNYFEENYDNGFMIIFKDNILKGVLTTYKGKGFEVKSSMLLRGLFKYIRECEDPREIIESRRPQDYIAPDKLLALFKRQAEFSGYQFVLIALTPNQRCPNKRNIIQVFDEKIKSQDDKEGILLFDSTLRESELKTLAGNLKLSTPLITTPDGIETEVNRLVEKNYSSSINLMFVFKRGKFYEALYVWDCTSLYTIL